MNEEINNPAKIQKDYHPWKINEPELKPNHFKEHAHYASLFSLGNGYLGFRASHEDDFTHKKILSNPVPGTESGNPVQNPVPGTESGDSVQNPVPGTESGDSVQNPVPGTDFRSSVPDSDVGTYLNGFYESGDIQYGEIAYGYARESQTQLNVVNPLPIRLIVDGNAFSFYTAYANNEISQYQRTLSMSDGVLERRFVWTYKPGRRVLISSRRLVSQTRLPIAAISYQVYALDHAIDLFVESMLDGTVANKQSGDDPRIGSGLKGKVLTIQESGSDVENCQLYMSQQTNRSNILLGCVVSHKAITSPVDNTLQQEHKPHAYAFRFIHKKIKNPLPLLPCQSILNSDQPGFRYQTKLNTNEVFSLEKSIAFTDTRKTKPDEVVRTAAILAKEAADAGFDGLYNEQKTYMENFWHHSQVKLSGDLALQQGLHFNTFHLLQSAGRDGQTSVSAKGLSGEGYEGHYFWDTEMYILPFFLHTMPDISRAFLTYRYQILPQARKRAREMGHKQGALFAWRTINGHECSAYYPAGTAQYHINADIAYAVSRYQDATGDDDFIWQMGAEILAETAALWLNLGFYSQQHGGKFCIQGVTGPDEYNVLVDNNYYTNLMAQANLLSAAKTIRRMAHERPQQLAKLSEKLNMNLIEEAELWLQAAEQMYFPFDDKRDICLQDDAFLKRMPWDFDGTPESKYPLLLHFHPLVIYRHQVCKQADMVLAQFMHGNRFSFKDKKRAFQYYESCTTHDSSLSASIYAVMACELGLRHKAYRYFMETARLDLENRHHNTVDGLHLANMAGTWMVMINGYAGLRIYNGRLHFKPQINEHWESYEFRFVHQGCLLNVAVSTSGVLYQLLEGDKLSFEHFSEKITLTKEKPQLKTGLQPLIKRDRGELRAVIFDVDGVLLSTDEQHYLAWKRLADEERIYFDKVINGRLRGVSRMASLEILLEKSDKTYNDKEKHEMATRKNNYYKEQISKLTPDSVLPGVVRCLEAFLDMGIRLATGSSSKNAPTLLEKTGLASYFEVTSDGNNITRSKPDPEVFLVAADRLGLLPEQCLVVEDAVSGIEAAKAGGFRSLAVGDASRQSLRCNPDAQAHSLKNYHPEDIQDIY